MTSFSVVIITFNEEKHIVNCLESVKHVADEVVVVDSFSTDQTEALCKRYGVRFIRHAFEGNIEQKNFALTQAKFAHVLSLDADECLSPELQQSILAVKNNWQHDGYAMNRLNNFCGKWIRHGGWYPDRKLRLFDSRKGKWDGRNPHDKFMLVPGATSGFLKGDLLHFTADSEKEYLKKMDRYTDIAARELSRQGKHTNMLIIYLKTAVHFIRNYIFLLGFLDGLTGLRLSRIGALYTYQKYSKLLQLKQDK
jgi:glycosyltransferase involved in cell wall biosynthesis